MTPPRQISRRELDSNPHVIWNRYVECLATCDDLGLSATQRAAHLVFAYESEVRNGGHLQYFENHGISRVADTVESLKRLSGDCQANILSCAAARYLNVDRPKIRTVDAYVEAALDDDLGAFDEQFHRCDPSLMELLQQFLQRHQDEFIVVVE